MQKGDKVYVNWPTGRSEEPCEVIEGGVTYAEIETKDGGRPVVPAEWCKLAEPGLEEGRLYYIGHVKNLAARKLYFDDEAWEEMSEHEPVHRRWWEISEDERKEFASEASLFTAAYLKYQKAYELITGEEHP